MILFYLSNSKWITMLHIQPSPCPRQLFRRYSVAAPSVAATVVWCSATNTNWLKEQPQEAHAARTPDGIWKFPINKWSTRSRRGNERPECSHQQLHCWPDERPNSRRCICRRQMLRIPQTRLSKRPAAGTVVFVVFSMSERDEKGCLFLGYWKMVRTLCRIEPLFNISIFVFNSSLLGYKYLYSGECFDIIQ